MTMSGSDHPEPKTKSPLKTSTILHELLNLIAVIKIKQRTVTPYPYGVGLTVFVNYTNRGDSGAEVWGVGR